MKTQSAGLIRGFTLLEVLVALAILSISLIAALRAGAVATQNAGEIRQRLLADWVARDRLEEHRARRDFPPLGSSNGETTQAGVRFRWEEKVVGTPNYQFRRIDIRVLPAETAAQEQTLAKLTGFLIKPGG